MKTSLNAFIARIFILPVLFACIILSQPVHAQEFTVYDNGLIYSPKTMKQLGFIVDSLNIKFRACELAHNFYSVPQACATYVRLDSADAFNALQDMDRNMPLQKFKVKYSHVKFQEDLLTLKYKYVEDSVFKVSFSGQTFTGWSDYDLEIENDTAIYHRPVKDTWVYELSNGRVYAFYFKTEFQQTVLPEYYARMVQYSECMVDTSTNVFFENASRNRDYFGKGGNPAVIKALKYAKNKTNGNDEFKQVADTKLMSDHTFKTLLRTAADDAVKFGGSNDELEFYVGMYLSKEDELKLKRSRVVWGQCSMDDSPRRHALNIAMLSAETVNWEVFLRAHLNIMNDRFPRMSDGSYAWGRRETYLRELEELDINVTDLMLGISLHVSNPGKNHYYGSIGRLGRALAETQHKDEVETRIIAAITDTTLDDYNRVLMYYLFDNYNYNLQDEAEKKANAARLEQARAQLPTYLAERIKDDEP